MSSGNGTDGSAPKTGDSGKRRDEIHSRQERAKPEISAIARIFLSQASLLSGAAHGCLRSTVSTRAPFARRKTIAPAAFFANLNDEPRDPGGTMLGTFQSKEENRFREP